jgi:chemosensory pili system protein ChpA (sensor histidine kinase/response regulator)
MARKARKVGRDDILGLCGEIRQNLPAIDRGIQAFAEDPSRVDDLFEAYRLTHTIKGAASMVGLAALSHIAHYQEEVLEQLAGGEAGLSDDARALLGTTAALIGRYADGLEAGDVDGPALLSEAVRAYRRFRALPEHEDPAAIEQVLAEAAAGIAPGQGGPGESAADGHYAAFRAEAEDHLRSVAADLHEYVRDPGQADRLHGVRGRVHSLKGAAGTIGLNPVARLSHRLEDLIEALIQGALPPSEEAGALLLAATDALEDLVKAGPGGESAVDLDGLFGRFAAALGGEAAEAAPAATPAPAPAIELDDLDSISPELLEVFSQEAEDHIRNIYTALGELEKQPENRDALRSVRHCAHTLKGAAGAVKLRCLTKLAHRMEDLLDILYDEGQTVTAGIVKLLYATTDALNDLAGGRYDREAMLATVQGLYSQYEALLSGAQEAAAAAPPAPVIVPTPVVVPAAVEVPAAAVLPAAAHVEEVVIDLGGATVPAPRPAAPPRRREKPAAAAKKPGEVVRVPVERLDELVRLVTELVINRTGFEQRMVSLLHAVEEHRRSLDRIRRVSSEIETHYEVSELGGRRLSGPSGVPHNRIRFFAPPTEEEEFDELELDRYTKFHLLSRSLSETTGDIGTIGNELHNLIGDFDALLLRQGRLSREIQDKLMRIRMVPLATLATSLQRAVRVVAQQQGKHVDLVLDGEQTELDKTVLDEMADAFLHLLRNAVDHGVEPPSVRVVQGKPERATVRVRAYYQGTQVVIEVGDDGAGLDPSALREAAVRGGHLSPVEAEAMSDREALQLIFLPGLSTASGVSEVSGRGVGMEIVRAVVHKLKGTLLVDSTPGRGTTFTVSLPMTLAITRALMIRSHGESFAIPVQAVTQILRVEREKVEKIGHDAVIRAGGNVYPLVRLGDLLGLRQPPDESRPMLPVLIITAGTKQVAVVVDQLVANREIVVKTLGSHLRRVHGLIGATLLGDGTVVPILDPIELIQTPTRHVARPSSPSASRQAAGPAAAAAENWTIMVVDDSVSVRRVVSNLVKNQNWHAVTARDGLEALETLQKGTTHPDLILLDIEMPRMDGYELLAMLRSAEAYQNLPVVMVTSRAGEKHRRKAMELGATEYVVKPYEDEALLNLIRRLVRQSREAVPV